MIIFPPTTPVTDVENINFTIQAQARIFSQYTNSPLINKLILGIVAEVQLANDTAFDMFNKFLLDTATGDQLDTLGAIVGQPRFYITPTSGDYFSFADFPGFLSFFDANGGIWAPQDGSVNQPITDDQYRLFIRAKIYKNQMSYTLPEIEALAQFVFQDPGAFVTEPAPLTIQVTFTRQLKNWEIALLQPQNSTINKYLIPPPAGVTILFDYADSTPIFSFADFPGGTNFHDGDGSVWAVPI